MPANFPTAAPDLATNYVDDSSDIMAANQNQPNLEINAIAAKIGTASSTPTANKILMGNGTGTSTWGIDFKDEDDMASNSATAVSSQQALKAYVDSKLTDWKLISATLTYSSADDPTYVVTTSADLTASVGVGMRIKFTNNSTTFYGIVTAITTGTITLYGGTDYDVANSAITNVYYSGLKAPIGFSLDPAKWMVQTTHTSNSNQASPVQNTWYNTGTVSLAIPIGVWDVSYQAGLYMHTDSYSSGVGEVTLSTANNTESDADFTSGNAYIYVTGGTSSRVIGSAAKNKYVTLAAKATYYLNIRTVSASVANIALRGDVTKTIVRAVCAYL